MNDKIGSVIRQNQSSLQPRAGRTIADTLEEFDIGYGAVERRRGDPLGRP